MTPWLSVIGIGEDGLAGVSPAARTLIEGAEVLAGGARHLAMIPPGAAERLPWPSPFATGVEEILARRGRAVCVLASGDPMWFGIGATLARHVDPAEMTVLPHPGAFSLAAARMLWPLHEAAALTVHGRPIEALALHLRPGARLLVLSEDGRSPSLIADLLRTHGYGDSRMTVFEHLGGAAEARTDAAACDWEAETADLNTVAVLCRAAPGVRVLSTAPGLPDDAFLHDGQLTKREIRAVTLAALGPLPGAVLWDLGAGCGSIAIEWMRAGGRAAAVERSAARCGLIARNAAVLGVPGLDIVQGAAPAVLPEGRPDAVFVGGGCSQPGLLDAAWAALPPGGRMVANAVTAEGEAALLAWRQTHGGALTRLAVSRLGPTGSLHTWHPAMPVTQYAGDKP